VTFFRRLVDLAQRQQLGVAGQATQFEEVERAEAHLWIQRLCREEMMMEVHGKIFRFYRNTTE
jgi:hypothetical protein